MNNRAILASLLDERDDVLRNVVPGDIMSVASVVSRLKSIRRRISEIQPENQASIDAYRDTNEKLLRVMMEPFEDE